MIMPFHEKTYAFLGLTCATIMVHRSNQQCLEHLTELNLSSRQSLGWSYGLAILAGSVVRLRLLGLRGARP